MDFVNLDLTLSNPDNEFDDELYTDVGTGEFSLEHDMFFVGAALEIWTGAGGTGSQLSLTTDYTLHGLNESLTRRANRDVYQRLKIVNATYQTGDLYVSYWACADYITSEDTIQTPQMVGVPIPWFDETPPSWGLELDGSEISRTTYARLFDAYGEKFGNGDGSTTFDLPDLRGEILRGWDHARGRDPSAGSRTDRGDGTTGDHVGTIQEDAFQGHYHQISPASNIMRDTGANYGDEVSTQEFLSRVTLSVLTPTTGGHGAPRIDFESRPKNVAVMYITRY